MVAADAGDDRHLGVDDVGGVVAAEQTDLDHGDVDRRLGEPSERGGGDELEPARPHRHERLDGSEAVQHLGQVGVGDGLAVPGHALVDPLQVRAGERADAQSVGLQQRGHHGGDRPLAVGTGDVDDGNVVLRVGQQSHQLGHGGEARPSTRPAAMPTERALVVQVRVEPGQRLGEAAHRACRRCQDAARPRPGGARLAGAGHQGRVDLLEHRVLVHDDLAHVAAGRQLVHDPEQHLLEDGPQASGTGAAGERLLGDGGQCLIGELQVHLFELEELPVLLDQCVLGLDQDLDEGLTVEAVDHAEDRAAARRTRGSGRT